jgi:hypothetical protein
VKPSLQSYRLQPNYGSATAQKKGKHWCHRLKKSPLPSKVQKDKKTKKDNVEIIYGYELDL